MQLFVIFTESQRKRAGAGMGNFMLLLYIAVSFAVICCYLT